MSSATTSLNTLIFKGIFMPVLPVRNGFFHYTPTIRRVHATHTLTTRLLKESLNVSLKAFPRVYANLGPNFLRQRHSHNAAAPKPAGAAAGGSGTGLMAMPNPTLKSATH